MGNSEIPGHTAQLADEAWIEEVRRNADAQWRGTACEVVRQIALLRETFTTDAIWYVMDRDHPKKSTHEPRAMGAIMRDAAQRGWVRATARYAPSSRPECHSRPVRVWESLLYPGRG